jgi:hypothetical protein
MTIMKAINKNNWMIWAIVILAVMNMTTLITIIYHRNKVVEQLVVVNPNQTTSESGSVRYSGRYFRDELGLSKEQMILFSEFNPAFRQKVMTINLNLDLKRQEMLAEMAKQICDTNRLNHISDSIGNLHASLKKETYMYYINFKNICNKQQQKKLEQLFGEMFKSDVRIGQHGKDGNGGKHFGWRI